MLVEQGVRDVDKRHEKEFAEWFKHHVSCCHPIIYVSHQWHYDSRIQLYYMLGCRSRSYVERILMQSAKDCLHSLLVLISESRQVQLAVSMESAIAQLLRRNT